VDGEEVGTWSDLIARLSGDTHTIRVVRVVDKQLVREDLTLAGPGEASAGPYANRWGLLPATLFVTHVDPESAADKAGILAGDRLTAVDGREVLSFDHLRDLVAWSAPGGVDPRPVKVELERDGQQVTVELTPSWRLIKGEARMRPIMGVGSAGDTPVYVGTARRYYSLFEAVPRAWDETVAAVDGTAALLGNLLMVRGDPRDNLGGVISIFYTAGKVAERGFFEYATMLSMISVSLGLFNLLPVPVLDGGQMLFYLVEAVRGRPIALEIRERLLMAGALGMAVLVVLVFFLDVQRMVGG
jgi:regulator of sigma E protease